jgi:hypothetical protein
MPNHPNRSRAASAARNPSPDEIVGERFNARLTQTEAARLAITMIAALTAISAFAAEDTQVQVRPKGNKITRTTTRRVVKPVHQSRTTTPTTNRQHCQTLLS